MIELDGSDGGGQLLRTALALSADTGTSFRMENVRGGRSTPGLRPQHLAAVRVLADVTDAEVGGAAVGSETLEFRPGPPKPGAYGIDVGTAGSVSLVFDALLPLVFELRDELSATVRGGTDVKWSPPSAYYERVKLPLLRRSGVAVAIDVDRRGFYPAGGGIATLRLFPCSPEPLRLVQRGSPEGTRIYSIAATELADADVAERQAETAATRLEDDGQHVTERTTTYVETDCPGSALVIRADYGSTLAGFDALGERGKPAEEVADEAVEDAIDFRRSDAAVDRYTADQLLPVLALAGGRIRIPEITEHVRTNLRLVAAFGFEVDVERDGDDPVLVARAPRRLD